MKKAIDIQIGEKKFNCPLGLGLLGECLETYNLDITELNDKLTKNAFKWTPILIYESIKYSGVDMDFTKDDLVELLDNDEKGYIIIAEFNNAFTESLLKNVPKQEPVEKGVRQKKKVEKKS